MLVCVRARAQRRANRAELALIPDAHEVGRRQAYECLWVRCGEVPVVGAVSSHDNAAGGTVMRKNEGHLRCACCRIKGPGHIFDVREGGGVGRGGDSER